MFISKRMLILVISFCAFGAVSGSDQGGWFSNSWFGSFFKKKPVQPEQFIYRGRTPQEVAYEDLRNQYGCDSNDPEALCNITIPEVELSENEGSFYDSYIGKRSSVQKPLTYDITIRKNRTPRSYLKKLFVPKFWAGSNRTGSDNAIDDIYDMQDRPDLAKMLENGGAENYDSLVKGLQERMEEKIIKQGLNDVKRNENKIKEVYDSIDKEFGYAMNNMQECYSRHQSPDSCGIEEGYAKEVYQDRNDLINDLRSVQKDFQNAKFKFNKRKDELQRRAVDRKKLERKISECQKWADFEDQQTVGE